MIMLCHKFCKTSLCLNRYSVGVSMPLKNNEISYNDMKNQFNKTLIKISILNS